MPKRIHKDLIQVDPDWRHTKIRPEKKEMLKALSLTTVP